LRSAGEIQTSLIPLETAGTHECRRSGSEVPGKVLVLNRDDAIRKTSHPVIHELHILAMEMADVLESMRERPTLAELLPKHRPARFERIAARVHDHGVGEQRENESDRQKIQRMLVGRVLLACSRGQIGAVTRGKGLQGCGIEPVTLAIRRFKLREQRLHAEQFTVRLNLWMRPKHRFDKRAA